MNLTRFAVAFVLAFSVISTGSAGPAAATDDITQNAVGTYDVLFGNETTPTVFWAVDPCDDDADQCIQVTQFVASDTARRKPQWTKKAFWSVGDWIMEPVDGKRGCKDKTRYDVTYSFSWDAAANIGYQSFFEPGVCDGKKARIASSKITLARIA